MAMLTQCTNPSEKEAIIDEVLPTVHNFNHVDAAFDASKNFHHVNFQNVFPLVSHFVVHPEWISEKGTKRRSQVMDRPAWSWEQPKYRQNYKSRSVNQAPPAHDSKEEQFIKPESSDTPYKIRLLRYYTPWVQTLKAPADGCYKIPATVTREERPECFKRNTEKKQAPFMTTIQERGRLQFNIHY